MVQKPGMPATVASSSASTSMPHVDDRRDAVHTMLDANIAGAPVVNKAGQIVGVLTEADVIWKVSAAADLRIPRDDCA